MNDDFRNRVLTPLLLPLAVIAGIALFAVSLSRVFLAIPAAAATVIALLVAAYLLGIGAMVVKRRELSGRALGTGLVIGLVAVAGAGAAAAAIGPREVHPPSLEEETAEEDGEGGEEEAEAVEIPEGAAEFVAVDIDYSEAPETLPAGPTQFALVNEGSLEHNIVIEELGDEPVVEAQGGETVVDDPTLEAGQEYTYYCSIPGHREAGMEGTLTVEE